MKYRGHPVRKLFWIVESKDTKIPQFDEDGFELLWEDIPTSVLENLDKISFVPFSKDLAEKVAKATNGNVLAMPINFPVFSVTAAPGEEISMKRREKQDLTRYLHCNECNCDFLWLAHYKIACPKCGQCDEWYCPECKENKDSPIFLDDGQVLCPDCEKNEKKIGLSLISKLLLKSEIFYTTEYLLIVNGLCAMHISDEMVNLNTTDRAIDMAIKINKYK